MKTSRLGHIAKLGVSPNMLVMRAKLLRLLGLIPKQQRKSDGEVRHIFFSFPYHQLGDFVLVLTLLERVHLLWPKAEIDVAVGAAFAPLVEKIPFVTRTFSIVRPPGSDIGFGVYREFSNLTKCFRAQIAAQQYDLAVSPRWGSLDSHFGAYLGYLTGAPIRIGYSGANDGIRPGVDRLYTVTARGGAFEHESLRYSRLPGRCGFEAEFAAGDEVPKQRIGSLWEIAQQNRTGAERPADGKYVVMSPGASFLNKRWPVEGFAAVGRHLREAHGLRVVVVGSKAEADVCDSLCQEIGEGSVSLAGKTNVLMLVDVIAGAEIFVGNDSGASHIAGGLGIRTVVVNAFPQDCKEDIPNAPARFRPLGTEVRVVQPAKNLPPCSGMCTMNWQHCIQQVRIEDVCAAVDSLMALDGA